MSAPFPAVLPRSDPAAEGGRSRPEGRIPPRESFDAVLMILTSHDIYYSNPVNGWEKIDGPQNQESNFWSASV